MVGLAKKSRMSQALIPYVMRPWSICTGTQPMLVASGQPSWSDVIPEYDKTIMIMLGIIQEQLLSRTRKTNYNQKYLNVLLCYQGNSQRSRFDLVDLEAKGFQVLLGPSFFLAMI